MNESVLIVDDSLTVRMDLAEAFEAAGFRSLPCATAESAREALRSSVVGVVVLDVILPDGDGVELLRELRSSAAGQGAVVIMLSTEAEVRDRVRALQTGADEYVGKPYDTSYIIAKACELLRVRHSTRPPGRTKVLVIDDSPTFRHELHKAFTSAGYGVLTAGSGEEGLRIAANQRPAAIIVDGMLPGVDGATVVRRIRLDAALRGTPCILLTASEERSAELRALDAGADAFVRKQEDFAVILAKLAAALRSTASPREASASTLGPRKVLAVDDSITYLQELAAALRSEGYDVVLAPSGEAALELLAVETVDCVLLDLMMPGLGGQETCRRIKAAPHVRDVPLIMLTALEDRSAMLEGLGAGADDYIAKSGEFEVLKARVRAQIRRKQFEDENRRIREQLLHTELEASEARAARELAEARASLVEELEQKNKELEAFSYSVSHDLRAPLRTIDGFSQALMEDHAPDLDASAVDLLQRMRKAAQRMAELIDDMLSLSRVGRAPLMREDLDFSNLLRTLAGELQQQYPERKVALRIAEGMCMSADPRLLQIVVENLLANAWKFSSKVAQPEIEAGMMISDVPTYWIKDNGSGFDPAFAEKLFRPFQRLHSEQDFPGTGIGLATVHRVIERHGGRIWADAKPGQGATFYFTVSRKLGAR